MAANTYGVTASTVQEFFPIGVPFTGAANVDTAFVTSWIARVADDVRAAVAPSCANDADITSVHSPIAHSWLARTLAMGAAVRVMEVAGSESALLTTLRGEYADRIERLHRWPQTVLSDLASFTDRGGSWDMAR